MEITATMVKELRSQSGAGIMECKSALKETSGDVEAAITFLRKKDQQRQIKNRIGKPAMVQLVPTFPLATTLE